MHRIALLSFAEQRRHRHAQVLTHQVEQRRLNRGQGMDGGSQIKGLQATPPAVAIGKLLSHLVQDGLQLTDRLTLDQGTRVFQGLTDFFAAGHLTQTGVARTVGHDDDVTCEEGGMCARQVEQHAISAGNWDDAHLNDARGFVGLSQWGFDGCVWFQKRGCRPVKWGSYLRICDKSSRCRMGVLR